LNSSPQLSFLERAGYIVPYTKVLVDEVENGSLGRTLGFKNKVLLAWNGFSWLGILPSCVLLLCVCHLVAAWLVHTSVCAALQLRHFILFTGS